MNGLKITFLDQTGAKKIKAMISPTVQVKAMIQTIITKMSLPAVGPDGQPMSYSLDHKEGGKRLLEDDTLPGAGVKEGDSLIVYPEIVAGIDTMEYQRLIAALDQDIEQARRDFEERERRERVEQRKKLLLHWQEGLTKRKADLERYGGAPSIDLNAKLDEIAGELKQIEAGLVAIPDQTAAISPPAKISEKLLAALTKLIEDANGSAATMEDLPFEERVAHLRLWAARWRLYTIEAGEAVVAQEKAFRWGYAAIAHLRDAVAPTARLDGLHQSATRDLVIWKAAEERHFSEVCQLGFARAQRETMAQAHLDAVEELSTYIRAAAPPSDASANDPAWDADRKTFRHLVRTAASFQDAREEIAFLCREYRAFLGDEFRFLWKDEEPEKEPEAEVSKKLTRLQIVQRLCRRLKAKAMIGACHAPWAMVVHGFPSHDYGRAEEAMEVLSKVGIVRRRRTGIGVRVSLEPTAMPDIDLLIGGAESGSPTLNAWMKEE